VTRERWRSSGRRTLGDVEALGALIPSIGVGLIFWFAVRAMIQADRRERAALAQMDRRAEQTQDGAPGTDPT
jgi:hypothetical protein